MLNLASVFYNLHVHRHVFDVGDGGVAGAGCNGGAVGVGVVCG